MVKPIIFLYLVIALGIILAFLQLLRYAKNYYILYNQAKLYPLNQNYPQQHLPSESSRLCILGDSRAAQWTMDNPFQGRIVDCLGVNGFTSEQLKIMLQTGNFDFTNCVVLIQIGINDIKMIPLFPDKQDSILTRLESNLSFTIGYCKEKGAELVVVSTIFPIGKVPVLRRFVWSNQIYTALQTVNNYIKSVEDKKVITFDACELLEDKSQGPSRGQASYFNDALHLNSEGYHTLNKSLITIIKVTGS